VAAMPRLLGLVAAVSDFGTELHRKAEAHLDACDDALYAFEEGEADVVTPAEGPYCGCRTCIVREVLAVVFDDIAAWGRENP
jgi:hypothetical protein